MSQARDAVAVHRYCYQRGTVSQERTQAQAESIGAVEGLLPCEMLDGASISLEDGPAAAWCADLYAVADDLHGAPV